MDRENIDRLKKALDGVQESLTRRIPVVAVRSPVNLAEEVAAFGHLVDVVSQVRGELRVNGLYDLERNLSSIDSVEKANPGAEDDRRQSDVEFIDQPGVEILEYNVCTAGNPDVSSPGGLAGLPQGALDAVVDEIERRAARPLPRSANLLREDEDAGMKGSLFRPETLSSVEHPLAHDARPCAVEGLLH